MSRNPKAEIGPAHGLAVLVWSALDSSTWEEFGLRLAASLRLTTGHQAPRDLRKLIRTFWPSDDATAVDSFFRAKKEHGA